jgi:hypothetical protein
MNKIGIAHIVLACGCVDAGNPELSELTFPLPAIPVAVLHGFFDGVFGSAVQFRP